METEIIGLPARFPFQVGCKDAGSLRKNSEAVVAGLFVSDAAIRCDPAPMAEVYAISTANYLDMLGSRILGQGCSA